MEKLFFRYSNSYIMLYGIFRTLNNNGNRLINNGIINQKEKNQKNPLMKIEFTFIKEFI